MGNHAAGKQNKTRKLLAIASALVLAATLIAISLRAQAPKGQAPAAQPPTPQWQIDAGGKMEFDVASVKRDTRPESPATRTANMPLGPQDAFTPTGGLFSINERTLEAYVIFAYKLGAEQDQAFVKQAPKWALDNRYDIQARGPGNPTKDQYRLMVQALLADRFKLALHMETRQLPVYALVLNKAGKLGPQLKPHPDDVSCPATPSPHPAGPAPAPFCGALLMWPVNGQWHARMMNLTMEQIAHHLNTPVGTGWGGLDHRPIVDQTGLSGKFDFDIEFTPETNRNSPSRPAADAQPEVFGPTFLDALKDQLGLKLVKQTAPVQVFVIDHVERPTEN